MTAEIDIKQKILTESAQWLNNKGLVFNETSVQNVKEFTDVVSSFSNKKKMTIGYLEVSHTCSIDLLSHLY